MVTVDEECTTGGPEAAMKAVRAIVERHQGKRPVVLVIRLRSGGQAELATSLRASGCPEMMAELASLRRHKGTEVEHGTTEAGREGG